MHVETITVGPFESNCYLVHSPPAGDTLVIDPGGDAAVIIEAIRSSRLRVVLYLLTHGHIDHVSALAEVHRAYPAPVAMHPIDQAWAFTEVNAMPPFYPPAEAPPVIARALKGGQTWTDAGFRYEVLDTPGHSPGSVSFNFPEDRVLFPGDVLFRGSMGRTDLPGGNPRDMAASLRRLMQLPDDTTVYPGHGPCTTIGHERRTNPFLLDV